MGYFSLDFVRVHGYGCATLDVATRRDAWVVRRRRGGLPAHNDRQVSRVPKEG